MKHDRILVLCVGIFFIFFSLIIRFIIISIIKRSKNRTEDSKLKEVKIGKIVSVFLFLIGLYWTALFMFYNKLF